MREMLITSLSGLVLAALLTLLGAPIWIAVGFGVIQAEIRQSRLLAATKPTASDLAYDSIMRTLRR